MNATQKIANALRVLSIDAVFHANSGHPGMPLGMADIAAVLWTHFLKFASISSTFLHTSLIVLTDNIFCVVDYFNLNILK
jgi:transketolase